MREKPGCHLQKGEGEDIRFALFRHKLRAYEAKLLLSIRQDEFLDAYSEWRKAKDPVTQKKVLKAARVLSSLDPHFQFCLPK